MSETLKPCPWGHENQTVGTIYDRPENRDLFEVRCLRCMTRGPLRLSCEEAIAAWNERPAEDVLAKENVELKETLLASNAVMRERLDIINIKSEELDSLWPLLREMVYAAETYVSSKNEVHEIGCTPRPLKDLRAIIARAKEELDNNE
jgi:hypothetical protein